MLKEESTDLKINKYYDGQMSDYELINFEAGLALSDKNREYTGNQCYEYFKISNSIKLVKNRLKDKSEIVSKKFKGIIDESIVDINSVCFKGFYKHLRNGFLNILRHNSK